MSSDERAVSEGRDLRAALSDAAPTPPTPTAAGLDVERALAYLELVSDNLGKAHVATLRAALSTTAAPERSMTAEQVEAWFAARPEWTPTPPTPTTAGLDGMREAALIIARLNLPRGTTGQGARRLFLNAIDAALARSGQEERDGR